MRLLLDTHVLIWTFVDPRRLSLATRKLLEDSENDVIFSVISLWEIGVKRALKRSDFEVDPYVLRSRALAYGYQELLLSGEHVLAIHGLPSIHRDPYDRLLACQALTEDMTLLTKDSRLLEYPVTTLRA